ncbi:hypothetical protein ACX40Y_04905 [Sphingomonas sp. RS6]
MKTRIMIAVGALVASVPALAEDWDFILINSTGKTVTKVEIAAGGSDKWEADKVDEQAKGEKSVKPGARTTIHFDKGSGCKYDLRATFDDKTSAIWSGINVCDNSYVTIKYAGEKPTFTAN